MRQIWHVCQGLWYFKNNLYGHGKKCKKMKRYIYCIFRCMAIKRHQLIYPNLTRKWKMTQTPPRIINVDNIRIKLTKGLIWHVNPTTSKLYRLYDQTQTLTIPTWLARHIWRSGATLFINGSLVLFFLFYNAEIKQNSVHGITGVVWGKLGHLLHETFMLKPFPQWCRHGHGCCTIDIDKDKRYRQVCFWFFYNHNNRSNSTAATIPHTLQHSKEEHRSK